MENKKYIFISSGLSGGAQTDLVKNTKTILSRNFNILITQFASDPDYKDKKLKNYNEESLDEIYSNFDESISKNKPCIFIGHSFSALLLSFYLLERPEVLEYVEKIIMLDPSDAEEIYKYIISNQDGFSLDKSIVNRLGLEINSDLIQKIKSKGVEIFHIESSNYGLDHEFKDLAKLREVYVKLGLI